jgi:hypothetical protein
MKPTDMDVAEAVRDVADVDGALDPFEPLGLVGPEAFGVRD